MENDTVSKQLNFISNPTAQGCFEIINQVLPKLAELMDRGVFYRGKYMLVDETSRFTDEEILRLNEINQSDIAASSEMTNLIDGVINVVIGVLETSQTTGKSVTEMLKPTTKTLYELAGGRLKHLTDMRETMVSIKKRNYTDDRSLFAKQARMLESIDRNIQSTFFAICTLTGRLDLVIQEEKEHEPIKENNI